MKTSMKRQLASFPKHVIAFGVSLSMFVPIYLLIVNSLKTRTEASSMGVDLPAAIQWSNFAVVVEKGKLATAFSNSLLYAVAATLIGTMVAALAAYALSRSRTRFNRGDLFLIVAGIAMPTNFVTLTKVMQVTHLINTQLGIILLYAAMQIPFSVFLIYAFVETFRANWMRLPSWTDAVRPGCFSRLSSRCSRRCWFLRVC